MREVEESLYIKILVWAYERQEQGFLWGDLEKEFGLNRYEKEWAIKVFRSNTPSSDNLVDHIYNQGENSHKFFITSKGTSAAVDYLNLKEAKNSSRRAEIIALVAVIIGIVVGVVQILTQLLTSSFLSII